MCEFCEDARIINQMDEAYGARVVERRIELSNARAMLIKFEERKWNLTPRMKMDEILKSQVKFCPICGRKLIEMED